jgi:hypothetical protein
VNAIVDFGCVNALFNPQDRIAVCLSVVLPPFYGLVSTSRSWSNGTFDEMDSGVNIFIFPPVFAIAGTITPSSPCLTSTTSGPAHVPLYSAEVMLYMLISHLLYFLIPLWVLRGVTLISMM